MKCCFTLETLFGMGSPMYSSYGNLNLIYFQRLTRHERKMNSEQMSAIAVVFKEGKKRKG